MFLPSLLSLALAAQPAEPKVLNLSAPELTCVGLEPAKDSFLSEHLAVKFAEQPHVHLTSQKDMVAVLGLERQQQLLGCSKADCAAELAGALGVDALVTGQVARVGQRYQLDVKVLSGRDARPLFVTSKTCATEEALVDALGEVATEAAARLWGLLGPAEAPAAPLRWAPFALTAVGVAAGVAGGVFLGQTAHAWSTLTGTSALSLVDARRAQADGRRVEPLGYAFAGLGVAALTAGLLWYFAGAPPPVQVSVGPGGAQLSWVGVLP
jgi:hypothetical protein